MLKNKLNYVLVNFTLISLIIYLVYKSRNLWLIIFSTIYKILMPFIFAFFIAYIFYPILRFFNKKNISKLISIPIIFFIIIGVFSAICVIVFPKLYEQIIMLLNYLISFINQISKKYDIDFFNFEKYIYEIIKNIAYYLSGNAINFFSLIINYINKIFIILTLSLYFLIDMDKIRAKIKNNLYKRNSNNCIEKVDIELNKFFIAFLKIMIISFFEYSICYIIIGHPNALLLGVLVSIFGIIPYIGGVITNIIAAITAFAIGPNLFIKTIITSIILSIVDGYIINPLVYGKSNQIHPIIIIFACTTGGVLGGVLGMILSLPITIVIYTFFKFYLNDLYNIKNKIKFK